MADEENLEDQDVTGEEIDLNEVNKDDNPGGSSTKPQASAKPEPTTTTTGGLTTPTEIAEGTKAWFSQAKGFAYVELSSLVLMFACIGEFEKYTDGLLIYAIIVAVISLVACLGLQTMEYMKPGTLKLHEKKVSLGLLLWWAVGCWVITFRGPFTITSNGYFSAWGGLFFTAQWALHMDTAMFTELPYDRKLLALLATCGMLEVFSCIKPLVQKSYTGEAAYGLVVGIITFLVCGYLFKGYTNVKFVILKATAGFLFAIWAICAGLLTFGGPFGYTGNGYFASWGGFLFSAMFGLEVMTKEDDV